MHNFDNNHLFERELRRALHNLYDPSALRNSLLITLFNVNQAENPSLALRNILTNAIDSLKPKTKIFSKTKVWRYYQILFYRFIEHTTQKEVATNLNLSLRHLRREETGAVQLLANNFWTIYNLEAKLQNFNKASPDEITKKLSANGIIPTREEELNWLRESLPSELVNIREIIQTVLGVIEPLSRSLDVQIDFKISNNSPLLLVQLTSVRQALINIVTMAIHCVPSGQVYIEVKANPWDINILVQAKANQFTPALKKDDNEVLKITRQLIGLSGGSLEILTDEHEAHNLVFQLRLPGKEQIPVLIIDDNPDLLRLFERYLSNTHYRFIGTSDPEKATLLVEKMEIRIIVLDIMLPGIDGWEFLGRLRVHPSTHHVPIIVCTILPQEQLALALGAAGFIRKPLSRQSLLAALNQQTDLFQKESH
jgi:CheY-like chemotaxis protein